jgi:hypothetical protein
MLGLGWAVSVCTDVIAHKLKSLEEDVTFHETQQEMIHKANTKLTFHILQGCVEVFAVTEDVINNVSCVCLLVDCNLRRCDKSLPLTVDIIDKINEGCWAVDWPKRHNCISPFDCIRSFEKLASPDKTGQPQADDILTGH